MGRVFVSEGTGAAVYVFADDHCPPHVHVRHRGQDWVARVQFSYAHGAVALMSIAPLRNIPTQRVVNRLVDDIHAHIVDCRRGWWTTRQTTCLANQWAVGRAVGAIEIVPAQTTGAKRIVNATYDPNAERLRVAFHDETVMELSLGK